MALLRCLWKFEIDGLQRAEGVLDAAEGKHCKCAANPSGDTALGPWPAISKIHVEPPSRLIRDPDRGAELALPQIGP